MVDISLKEKLEHMTFNYLMHPNPIVDFKTAFIKFCLDNEVESLDRNKFKKIAMGVINEFKKNTGRLG
ncbi:MAG: hypothetical protein GY699_09460 [Desulfobacteraceae bacterium]|nr:hypothetical protein [Desulfobacteraceae bacterium]